MLLTELFREYARRKLRQAAPNTILQFKISIEKYAEYLHRQPRLDDFRNDPIEEFIYARAKERAAPTVNKNRANLLALWRYAARQGYVAKWPDVAKLVEPERIPVAWSREQLSKLWKACEGEPGHVACCPAADWWHALHAVIWDTAERISGVLLAEWGDVDLENGSLVIRAESRKGRKRDKFWRLHPTTCELLRLIELPRRRLVFPWLLSRNSLYDAYKVILERAGLPDDRFHKFHCLRKSVASYYEAAGGNATILLDHSSRDVTVKHYLSPSICGTERHASDVLFRPGKTG